MQRRRILRTLSLATAAVVTAGLGIAIAAPAAAEPITVSSADFEDGTTGPWGPRGGVSLTVIDTDAHGGAKSLAVTNRMANWQGVSASSTTLGLQPGGTYQFSAWVKLR